MAEAELSMGWGNLIDSVLRVNTGSITDTGVLLCFAIAIILGVVISFVYMYTTPTYTKNFVITIAISGSSDTC